jgi:glutamate carboxypeptidase
LQLSQEKYLTFNPGLIVGGSEMNYDADKAKGDALGKNKYHFAYSYRCW